MKPTDRPFYSRTEARRNGVPLPVAIGLLALAAVLGLTLSTVTADAQEEPMRIEFAEGFVSFCTGGELDHTTFDYGNPEDHEGSSRPEEAADSYIEEVRSGIAEMGELLRDRRPERAGEFADLMAPALTYRVGEQVASDKNGVVYFDTFVSDSVLSSRIVVEQLGEEYFVTDSYRCEDLVTKDARRLREVLAR